MPLINGQKMACAPCIRGHRSTKCNHAAERMMVPVRKPGRPLSSCACAPGQPCACGGVKVAIPRKQKCRCGPTTAEGDDADHHVVKPEMPTPALTPSDLPVSPTRNGVFRVQKSAPASRHNHRSMRVSFDAAHLARMDPNSINIVDPYNTPDLDLGLAHNGMDGMAPRGHPPLMSGMAFVPSLPTTGYQHPGIISYGAPLGYALVPIQSHMNNPGLSMAQEPVVNGPVLSSPSSGGLPGTDAPVRSCCAPAPAPVPVAQPQHQSQHVRPAQSSAPPRKSCCGGGSNEQPQSNPDFVTHQRTLSNGSHLNQLQPPFADIKQQQKQAESFVPYRHSTTIFTYPANLGTWNEPLNPAIWAQLQQPPQPLPNGPAFSSSLPISPNGGTVGPHTTHECGCGPGCRCVGCLAHPYNAQTLEYVAGAWDYESDVPYGATSSDKSNNGTCTAMNDSPLLAAQTTNDDHSTNGHGPSTTQVANGVQPGGANPETGSPIQAQTPSDASGFNEELPASDFMFVNLPLYPGGLGMGTDSDPCVGSSAFCPCGDDCQCIGCLVHNTQPLTSGPFDE